MIEQIVGFVMPLVYLIGVTFSLVFLTKRNFGKCLPLAMMGSAFLLFFSQLIFKTFDVGFVLGILFAMASVGLGIWKRKEWRRYKKLLFSSGFIVFVVVYVMVFIYDLARGFSAWDEFSHWGMMLKEMFRLDKFYSAETSNLLVHKDYPPIMQLFELLWIKLCGGYKEAFAERALHTFEFSLFIPFMAEKKNAWKNLLVGVATVFSILFVMIFFDQHGVIQTIYTDYVMAMMVVFLMMSILTATKISWFEIAIITIGGGFLLLLKQMGLPLYLMVLCFLIGVVWIRKNEHWIAYLKKTGWRKIVGWGACLFIPFVIWFIWGRLVADTVQQFDLSKISLSGFLQVIFGQGEAWQKETIYNYLVAIGQENISTSFIKISFLQSIVMFAGSLWCVYWFFRKSLNKREIGFLGLILGLGAVGYSVTMMVLYVLSFSSYEAVILASFNRYMGTYSMIMLLTVVFVVVWQATKVKRTSYVYAMAMCLALINAPEAYGRLYPYVKKAETKYDKYAVVAQDLKEVVGDDAKVFLVVQNLTGYYFYLQYYATPIKMNYAYATWITGENVNGKDYYERSILPRVKDYDYLLVVDTDDRFNELYCDSLKICPIKDKSLYRIKKNDIGEVKRYEFIKTL